MKIRSTTTRLLAGVLLLFATPAGAEPPADLDIQIAALMANGGPPGMSVAIVEDGKVTFAKGYGVKRLGGSDAVDANTIFEIGSVTKGFTSAALAILVDEGKIGWDDRVIDHLPEFRMYDAWVTREFTVRDLLTHRSGLGLGAGDLTIVPRTDLTRDEIVASLRYLKPVSSFRTTFSYNNLLYITAGKLIERVSGTSWDAFIRDRLLRPTGMAESMSEERSRYAVENRAQPHARLGPPMRGIGDLTVLDETNGLGPNIAGTGGVVSNAKDMAKWISLQLGQGQLPGDDRQIWSGEAARRMWSVATPLPTRQPEGPLADAMPRFAGYGLGWFIQDYNGHRLVQHAGGTLGFLSQLVLIPESKTGFVILTNSEDVHVMQALQLILVDHYVGRKAAPWAQRLNDLRAAQIAQAKAVQSAADKPKRVVPVSLPLPSYAGRYVDPWYGAVTITANDRSLSMNFTRSSMMVSQLAHHTGDTFIARWQDPSIEPAYVTFITTPDGKIEGIKMKAVSPIADVSYDYQDLDLRPQAAKKD